MPEGQAQDGSLCLQKILKIFSKWFSLVDTGIYLINLFNFPDDVFRPFFNPRKPISLSNLGEIPLSRLISVVQAFYKTLFTALC